MIIFKYPLIVTGQQEVMLPHGAKILSLQMQHQQLCLWALVDVAEPMAARTIAIYGTGHPLPVSPGTYLATVQDNQLVWHVFEVQQ